ncbi:MAG: sulfite exporter TauE/SafE family protein [Betaproteobacteria bacterium]|nr:MAG: sulfite exporter TauE/SafE family protein [Betaproteobacteria bacterium]
MELDLGTILLFAAIASLASFVYGVTGFGSGLIAIPLASHFHEMRFVLAVFALLDIVNAVRVTTSQPRAVVADEAVRLVPSCVLGVALGAVLILVLPARLLLLALGTFVSGYALYSLAGPGTQPTIGMRWAYVAGLSGGIASAMFGAGGPPYAIYLSMRPHGKEQIRATLAVTSLVSIGTRLIAFGFAGLLSSWTVWGTALAVAPVSLLALWFADRVHRGLSRQAVLRALRILLCLAGISLLVRAIAGA